MTLPWPEPPLKLGTLRVVLTGTAVPYTRPGSTSAIDKRPRGGTVAVGPLGLEGDEQGDLRVHGGPHKAVHCYPWAHYELWRWELAAQPQALDLLSRPGAFGENFSLDGLDETSVCLGDQWQVGSARLEVSQGRQPCWKLNDRFRVPDMALRLQASLRTGWYLRVLQPGQVQEGDVVQLLARPYPQWPLARILRVIAERECTPELLSELLALPLPPSWQRLFTRRLEAGQAEDWSARVNG
ncbi:MAG TPA: MOSC domain-containing protein [Comamonadaceae bacterium]|uniref:MOSC domain-containing protein n=1 Tax=Pulveribacter sp. TaxID=2678893 RepID=UPI000EBEFFC5|nr:MOSC domain-containing protein [Pulveribacter sp.]HCL87501.1 MOSC domain-containing protein [Comamonadaceae bacterium]